MAVSAVSRRQVLRGGAAVAVGAALGMPSQAQAFGIPVELFSGRSLTQFSCVGPFRVEEQGFGAGVWQLSRRGSQVVVSGGWGSAQRFPLPCRLFGGSLQGGRVYRGWIVIQAQGTGRLRLINWLDLEDYVLGVVTAEMPPTWPEASLQAQAILCRTRAYPYRQPISLVPRRWLLDSTQDQRYGGVGSEHPRGQEAVNRSRGQILTHAGDPIAVLYHSTCAGHTSANQLIFAPPPRPYLQGVPCSYCQASPFYQPYTLDLTFQQLEDLFGSSHLTLVESDPWGRPVSIRAGSRIWSGQAWWRQVGSQMGWGVLPGNRLSWQPTDAGIRITAQGAGHGVGLCQWGSRFLGEQGWDPQAILNHYFPGTRLQRL